MISLSRKTKANVMLVGKPGVGKTAIIEEMARQIMTCTCPEHFKKYYVISLSVNGVVAGTKYRGDFEAKMENLSKFIDLNPNVILFIDEVHQIVGAGKAEGSIDIATVLKPILARDGVKIIGATTTDEYAAISGDGALARRFDTHIVKEVDLAAVHDMCHEKINSLAKFHDITITSKDISSVIMLADKAMKNRAFPDKLLDLIDFGMAKQKVLKKKAFDVDVVREHVKAIVA